MLKETFKRVKAASKSLAALSDEQRNEILNAVADSIVQKKDRILEANGKDLAKMDKKNPLYDRLQLTEKRLDDIAADSLPTLSAGSYHQGQDAAQRSAPAPGVGALRCHRHDL